MIRLPSTTRPRVDHPLQCFASSLNLFWTPSSTRQRYFSICIYTYRITFLGDYLHSFLSAPHNTSFLDTRNRIAHQMRSCGPGPVNRLGLRLLLFFFLPPSGCLIRARLALDGATARHVTGQRTGIRENNQPPMAQMVQYHFRGP